MTTVDLIVFGLIGLAVIGGLIKGFDSEVKNFGKGFFGFLAAVLSCVLFGKMILSIPQIGEALAAFKDWLGSINEILTGTIAFNIIVYVMMFVAFYIVIAIVTALVGTLIGTIFSGVLKPANRVLGGVFSGTVMLGAIMVAFALISLIPGIDMAGNVSGAFVEPLYTYAIAAI